ncbi:MAG: SpoIID/LytB domain-containing protein [Bdellovibrionales bacterium]|nr:SpoIID/LytB domain-containing protein [Bdellovibrionales bacterium]
MPPLKWILLFTGAAAAQASVAPPASVLPAPADRTVRVNIGALQKFTLSGYDLSLAGNAPIPGPSFLSLSCRVNERGVSEVHYGLGSPVGQLDVSTHTGFLFLDRKPWREKLTVVAQGSQCLVVNTVDMEKYLAGLVNKEMQGSWPIEALKAQAVAARSYALFQIGKNRQELWDVDATTIDQVYDGPRSETAKSNRAVEQTRHEVLTWNDETIKAFYHANCGGRTETEVWGGSHPWMASVTCPWHGKRENGIRWKFRAGLDRLDRSLRKLAQELTPGFLRVASVEPGRVNGSRRLREIVLRDAEGRSARVPAATFRATLGNTQVKSTRFSVKSNGREVELLGDGFGHGAGMCQVGAKVMAQNGRSYRQILSHYYPLARLSKLE